MCCARVSVGLRVCPTRAYVLCAVTAAVPRPRRAPSPYRVDRAAHLTARFNPTALTASRLTAPSKRLSLIWKEKRWDHRSALPNLSSTSLEERGEAVGWGERGWGSSPTFFVPGFSFSSSLFPFEVARLSFKPHCAPTLNTRESVMNMYQRSIWQRQRWD